MSVSTFFQITICQISFWSLYIFTSNKSIQLLAQKNIWVSFGYFPFLISFFCLNYWRYNINKVNEKSSTREAQNGLILLGLIQRVYTCKLGEQCLNMDDSKNDTLSLELDTSTKQEIWTSRIALKLILNNNMCWV